MKKILAVFLSAALMASAVPSAAAGYSDTKGHWAEKQIDSFTELGLVSGHDGAFRPDASITRGELAVILDQIMDYQVATENSFTDLDQNFYTEAILKANAAGVMVGDGGRVRPNDPITRQEAAVMIAQAMRLEDDGSLNGFSDRDQVASWAAKSVAALAARGYVSGSDGQFKPNSPITRAEVVTILNQAVQKLVSAGETATGTVSGNVVVRGGDVTLTDLTVEDDLILADGIGQGDVTMENVTVNGRIIVRGGGEHSILMNNVRVGGGVVVNKLDGRVRIVTSGSTNMTLTVLESGAILVGDGFETVEISAEMAAGQVVELDGTFTALINHSASVTIQADGKINSVTASVPTAITGDDVDIGKITSGSSDVTLNDKVLPSTGTSSSGGGGGGGGSSSGDDDDEEPETPDPVYSITLDTDVLTLKVGETQTLTADVTVPEGQDDTVAWVSSDDTVASVSDTGLVTALAEGSASITASILNNAYSVSCDVTVTLAEPEPGPGDEDSIVTGMDTLTEERFDYAEEFRNGYAFAIKGLDCGYIDTEGNFTVYYQRDDPIASGDFNTSDEVLWWYVNSNHMQMWVSEEGLFPLYDRESERWGYGDIHTGEVVIQPQYLDACPFSEGRAVVKPVEGGRSVIDTKGRELFTADQIYEIAYQDGTIWLIGDGQDNDGYDSYAYLRDLNGTILEEIETAGIGIGDLIHDGGYSYALLDRYFRGDSNYMCIRRLEEDSFGDPVRDAETYYIDRTGKETARIPDGADFGYVWVAGEAVAYYSQDGLMGLFNEQGAVTEPKYKAAYWFSKGVSAVTEDGETWYLIDAAGQQIGTNTFEDAGNASENGYIPVMLDGKWGYADLTGEIVIPCQYAYASKFTGGIAYVKYSQQDEAYTVINTKGEQISEGIEPLSIYGCEEGFFLIEEAEGWCHIFGVQE